MGRPRIKVIETAIEPDKVEKLEKEKLSLSEESEGKIEDEVKAAKKVSGRPKKQKTRSSRYKHLIDLIDKSKVYDLSEAIDLIKKTASTKFDSTLEIHLNLSIDPSKSDQQIRKAINLPHGSGKSIKILVFGGDTKKLTKLGSIIGTEATIEQINKGQIKAEKIVATPEWVPKLASAAKVLGPKGLMPNPKSGTISKDPEKVVESLQSGMVEIKSEKSPILHNVIGKTSFSKEQLEENIKSLISEVRKSKPESVKKDLIKSVYLTSTMSPSIKVDLTSLK